MIGRIQRLVVRHSHINWALADQGMVSASNFAIGIMLARFLGLEEFGRYTLAWMVVMILHNFQGVLIIAPMMSIGPKQAPGSEVTYFGATAAQQILYGMLTFPLLWGGAVVAAGLFPEWNIDGLALPLACAAAAHQLQNFLRRYFFTRDRPAIAFAIDALRYPGQVAVLFWLFQTTPMDSMRVLWVVAALAMLAALVFGAALVKDLSWDRDKIFAVTRRHWQFSRWLLLATIVNQFRGQFFYIVAGALLGASAVGALRAADTLIGVTNIVVKGLDNVVPVRAARHFHVGGVEALKRFIIKVGFFGELFVVVAMIAVFVAPEFWLWLAFGDEYIGYGFLLRWTAAVQLFYFPVLPITASLRALESTRHIFFASAVSAATAVVCAYPLITIAGVTGAAAGMLIVNVVTLGANGYGLYLVMSRLTRDNKVV
jgi:O-antigen/teichoic acid export membrane protein